MNWLKSGFELSFRIRPVGIALAALYAITCWATWRLSVDQFFLPAGQQARQRVGGGCVLRVQGQGDGLQLLLVRVHGMQHAVRAQVGRQGGDDRLWWWWLRDGWWSATTGSRGNWRKPRAACWRCSPAARSVRPCPRCPAPCAPVFKPWSFMRCATPG